MMPKRIRCECGRVYSPAKDARCPACGLEAPGSGGASSSKDPLPVPDGDANRDAPFNTEDPAPGARSLLNPLTLGIAAAVLVGVLVIVLMTRRPSDNTAKRESPPAKTEPIASPTATALAAPTATPTFTAAAQNQNAAPNSPAAQPFDLPTAIANAAPGAAVRVPPGVYAGGLILAKPMRLVGTAGQVFIQSDGRECLSIRTAGAAVENIQFMCNGIGELPAISVADGAELSLDGCKLTSGTALGLTATGNASVKAIGSTFTCANGNAVRFQHQARGHFTQSSFIDTRVGLMVLGGANVELQSCAFERDGGPEAQGAAISISGANSVLTANDCHFTGNTSGIAVLDRAAITVTKSPFRDNGVRSGRGLGNAALFVVRGARATLKENTFEQNRHGLLVIDGSTLEMERCVFANNGLAQTQSVVLGTVPVTIGGEGTTATIRGSSFTSSAPYAISVTSGAKATVEDAEISGTQFVGLLLGERQGPPAHADIRKARFIRNGTGVAVYGGSSAEVLNSEARENKAAFVALDPGSRLTVTKTRIFANTDHGLHAFNNAELRAVDCDLRDNERGAQSGNARRPMQRGSLVLEDCRFGGNKIFGAGAYAKSDLTLLRCSFDGTDKTDVYRERGANVQRDVVPEASPAPSAVAEAEEEKATTPAKPRRTRASTRQRQRRPEDEAARILRRIFEGR
jgi:hypothetical protein